MESAILVIDDDLTVRTLLATLLRTRGYRVTDAEDGESGIVAAHATVPDLILLDVMMPGWGGFETCRRIKAHPELADVPVVFLTAVGQIEKAVEGFNVGAVDYITKPFMSEDVLARVAAHLRVGRRLRSYGALLDQTAGRHNPIGEEADRAKREQRTISQVTDFLLSRLSSPPSLESLAKRFATNERKLSEGFKRYLGTTVFGFVREQRLRQAAHLLRETDLPIQLISDQLGYKNNSDFTVSFKNRYGVPPRQFRKSARSSV
jgi:DNA-binding response OmpR family regulator